MRQASWQVEMSGDMRVSETWGIPASSMRLCKFFFNVKALRSQIRNPLCPIVVNAGDVGVATAKLRRAQQALKELELRYASNKWSVIVPIRVLQSVFR